jgi:hypothetical protein
MTATSLYCTQEAVSEMDDALDHIACPLDVTTVPWYCPDHDVYCYDNRTLE